MTDYSCSQYESLLNYQTRIKELETSLKDAITRIVVLESNAFPCQDCTLSSCDGCPHEEENQ